jgi:hypothetical protein
VGEIYNSNFVVKTGIKCGYIRFLILEICLTAPDKKLTKSKILDGDGNNIGRNPTITPVDEGLHDVSYVPPPVGDPYEVDVRYGGEPINGAPFKMTSSPDMGYTADGGDMDRPGRHSVSSRKDSDQFGKILLII